MRTRIGRDPKTGQRLVYNIDTGEVVDNHQCGSGFFSNMASAITSKAAKDLATKAADKATTTAATKVGEKAGQVISEKIDDKFGKKKPGPAAPIQPTIPEPKQIPKPKVPESEPKPKQTQKPKPRVTKENKGEEIVKLLQQMD